MCSFNRTENLQNCNETINDLAAEIGTVTVLWTKFFIRSSSDRESLPSLKSLYFINKENNL